MVEIVRIDGIKWWITKDSQGNRIAVPLCPAHNLRMKPPSKNTDMLDLDKIMGTDRYSKELECAEGPHKVSIPRILEMERQYVIDRVDAKVFKNMKVLNLDDEAVPIAESKVGDSGQKYFVTSRLMESKRGLQLVVYAGQKGKKEKAQIFIEPQIKRLAFDQNNLHPDEVFLEVTATFDDGSTNTIKKGKGSV